MQSGKNLGTQKSFYEHEILIFQTGICGTIKQNVGGDRVQIICKKIKQNV